MSNQNHFIKFRLLSLTVGGLLFLWFFFDANLSKSRFLKELGLQNPQILSYILVALLFFFLMESILEYNKMEEKEGWQSRFQLIFIIVFSISALITSYPKLVLNTFLHETTRKDLIIPIVTAAFSATGAVFFRIYFEVVQVFYKFRKRLLPSQWVWLTISGVVTIFGIATPSFLSSDSFLAQFAIRYIVFIMSFLSLFIIFTPKKKLFSENRLEELSKTSNFLDYQVELSEYASSSGLKNSEHRKKSHKKVMRIVKRQNEAARKNIKHRFKFLKEVQFQPEGNRFVPQIMEEEEERVLRVELLAKDQEKVTASADVKFKYVQSACKEFNRPRNKNDLRSFLTPMALKAYYLQILFESDPNELLFALSINGALNDLKELVTKRNPDINYIAENGWTPLLIAVANGHAEIAKYLLQKGADPNIANKLGASPLLYAAWYGNEEICRILVNYGANVNQQDMEGKTALMRVAISGHSSIAKFLIDLGADSQLADNYQKTALSYAEEGKFGDIGRFLRRNQK